MWDKALSIIKGKWKEIAIVLLVGVVSSWVTAFIKADVTKTAIKNPNVELTKKVEKLEFENNQLKKEIKAGRKIVEMYEDGKLIRKTIFDNFVETLHENKTKTAKTDEHTDKKSEIDYPETPKVWHFGGGSEVYTTEELRKVYVVFGGTLLNFAYFEGRYASDLKGSYSVSAGGGIRF